MGCIHFVGTEYSAGRDHTDRQLALFHGTNLNRRGLGTQNDFLIDIEGILLVSCRMVLRDIQRFEVVVVLLDFGTANHFVAHANENSLYLFQSDRIGMTMSNGIFLCRQGNVNHLIL